MPIERNSEHIETVREGARRAYADATGNLLTERDILEEFQSPDPNLKDKDPMYPPLPEGDKGLEVRFLDDKGEVVSNARDAVATLVISPARHPALYYRKPQARA